MTSRKEKRIDVQVEPSDDLQLVILVPANNTGAFVSIYSYRIGTSVQNETETLGKSRQEKYRPSATLIPNAIPFHRIE